MLWRRELLLMNSTREPGATVISRGLTTPAADMVILFGLSEGADGDSLSPHELRSTSTKAADASRTVKAIPGILAARRTRAAFLKGSPPPPRSPGPGSAGGSIRRAH